MAQLMETACYRCREQKLKCSRQIPSCSRCSHLGLSCLFPEPPDRKLLATFRSSARKRKAGDDGVRTPVASRQRPPPSTLTVPSNAEGSCADINSKLSKPLQAFLIDVYFVHMYNAWLLFHRPTLWAEIEAGVVPCHVLLSIYATATIFLQDRSALTASNAKLLDPLGDLHRLGLQWAVFAGREVLQGIDQPSIPSIQTCEILALFWFSAGQSQRNTMFSGIAYKAACTLRLDSEKTSPAHLECASESSGPSSLVDEIRRRLFWATWITNCINSDHYLIGTSVNNRIVNLPLPMDDLTFRRSGIQTPLSPIRGPPKASEPPSNDASRSPPSIMAEIVKLMMLWAAIGDHLEGRKNKTSKEGLADFFDLDRRLSLWVKSLHASLAYSKRNLYKQLVVEQQPNYVLVHALHYQCCLVLHSSLVPQFSGLSLDPSISVELINVSARVALKYAQLISELGSDLIALDWEYSRIPPFVGYCIYGSASIHIVFLFSRNESLSALARTKLISNLKVLKSMKSYWTNLERLWARINILFEAQTSRIEPSCTADRPSSVERPGETIDPDNTEMLVIERDTGKLDEHLSTSVLKYNICPEVDSADPGKTIDDIERMIHNDPLVRLIDRENSRIRQQQTFANPMNTLSSDHLPSAAAGHRSNRTFSFHEDPATTFTGEDCSPGPSFLQELSDEWWQVDFDDLTQTMLSHNDLFQTGL